MNKQRVIADVIVDGDDINIKITRECELSVFAAVTNACIYGLAEVMGLSYGHIVTMLEEVHRKEVEND